MNIRYCKKCLFPETKPDLHFNNDGICSACIGANDKDKNIDWKERKEDFFKIIEKFRYQKMILVMIVLSL